MLPLHSHHNKGQMLLISIVIVGLVALLVAGSLVLLGLASLNQTVVAKNLATAVSLNYACAEEALYRLRQSPSYTGSDAVNLNGNSCSFTVVDAAGDEKQLDIASTVGEVVRRSKIIIATTTPITIDSWQEIP